MVLLMQSAAPTSVAPPSIGPAMSAVVAPAVVPAVPPAAVVADPTPVVAPTTTTTTPVAAALAPVEVPAFVLPDPPKTRRKTPTSAPDSIRWESLKGKLLGKGSAGILVPEGSAAVVAVDPVTGGRSTVSVVAGRPLDFNAVAKGRLSVRAQPWADVKLGTKTLGTTPFDPLSLPAGEYVAVLSYEGKRVEKKFTIAGGRETIVAVNMLK